MMRRVGIVVAWVVATMVATMIAATAVGSVRGQVTDVPAIPRAGTVVLLATSTTTTAVEPSTTSPPTTGGTTPTTEPVTATTEATTTTTSSTTTTTSPPSTPPTTSAPTPTTTTTAPNGPAVTTHRLQGGEVRISALEPDVNLVSAFPFGGFSVEVEKSGPDKVEVTFESEDHKSSFKASWEDGELNIDIKEEAEDGHDDDDD
jgi:cytoskeletal protein RodZ